MNFYMILTGGMNARRTTDANSTTNIIRTLPAGTRVEGDELVKATDGRNWLKVLLIDGVQTTEPTHVATYTTSGTLVVNPPPPIDNPLPFQVGLNLTADSLMRVSKVEPDGTRTVVTIQEAGNYVIEFIANDSNAPFIHMD